MRRLLSRWSRIWVLAALGALLVGVAPHALAVVCDASQLVNAVKNASSGDSLNLASGCTYTLTAPATGYTTGLPGIVITLTINGNNATIQRSSAGGTPAFGLIFVSGGGSLTLNQLTLHNGSNGGPGGAIDDRGHLTLNDTTVSGSSTQDSGGGISVGVNATLTLNNSTVSGNTAGIAAGGIFSDSGTTTILNDSVVSGNQAIYAGGIFNQTTGSMTLIRSSISSNSATTGGGLENWGTVTITDSTINLNQAAGSPNDGGGIENYLGTLWLNRSTLTSNTATLGSGGGIHVIGGIVLVSNSTLNGNSAETGGAILVDSTYTGTLTLSNSTVANNSAFSTGGIVNSSSTGTVQFGSSIIASNSSVGIHNLHGTFNSLSYNVIDQTGDAIIIGDLSHDLINAAASPLNLGVPDDNGGPTYTMALGAGSVAIGHGNCDSLSGVHRVPTDQRGFPRKSPCDVGAYETQTTSANLLQNGDFSGGLNHWSTFGQITDQISGGVFQFYRNSGGASAVVFQGTGHSLPSGAPITVSLDLGNSSSVRKRAVLLVHETDFSDLQVCSFWILPNTPLRTYQMRAKTTKAWTNATLSVYASPADGLGYILLDNVDYEYHPELDVHETLCIDPGAPLPSAGSDSANLIVNGGFSSGLTPWGTFGHITSQIAGGVFKFYKTAGTPSGVVLQNTGVPVAGGVPIEAQFDLGNSSAIQMRATVLLQAADFSDLQVCTFWVPPNTVPQTYVMRTYSSLAWGGATLSVYPSTVAASGWTLLDNVSLLVRPTLFVSGTECYQPDSGVALAAQPVPEIPVGTPPGGVISALPPQIPEVGGQATGESPQHVAPTDTSGLDAPPPGG